MRRVFLKIIDDLFDLKTGSLPALGLTDEGDIPLVYGTTLNNGIVKFVSVDDENQIFKPPLITVSYLGTAFVQLVPFTTSVVDKSNIIILKPKKKMSVEELYFYSNLINHHAKFGFHYGRRMNMKKLKKLSVQKFKGTKQKVNFDLIFRKRKESIKISPPKKWKYFDITTFFNLIRSDFHAIDRLDDGNYPTVSRSTHNNGIVGFYAKPDGTKIYPNFWITVSTTSGKAYVQMDDFIATDNVVILEPKRNIKITTLFFIQFMINKASWRYSYGRQCYKNTFSKTKVYLPINDNNEIDEIIIEKIIKNTQYYNFIEPYLN